MTYFWWRRDGLQNPGVETRIGNINIFPKNYETRQKNEKVSGAQKWATD